MCAGVRGQYSSLFPRSLGRPHGHGFGHSHLSIRLREVRQHQGGSTSISSRDFIPGEGAVEELLPCAQVQQQGPIQDKVYTLP